MTTNTHQSVKDYLFISYAWEDNAIAEWIETKLTSYGYKVWRDKSSIYGGDRWTSKIEEALNNQAFRVLGLLSKHSLTKENPVKERTKAIQIGKRLGISNFLITINVDGISDLDWQTVDINYIDFSTSWASGLGNLIKTLDYMNAPRNLSETLPTLHGWMYDINHAERVIETLYMNIIEFLRLPDCLLRINLNDELDSSKINMDGWVYKRQNNFVYWSFELPWFLNRESFCIDRIMWRDVDSYGKMNVISIVKYLLHNHINKRFIGKGLSYDEKHRYYVFDDEASPNGRISYRNPIGKKTYIKTKGERNFSNSIFIYRLAFSCSLHVNPEKRIALIITPNYAFYEQNGEPIAPRKVVSRRKKMCKSLYNRQWLMRLYAIVQWLKDNKC
jgi:hypothetical protein